MEESRNQPALQRLAILNARLGYELASIKMMLALRQLQQEAKYNPNWATQPRAPRGAADGGQWIDGGATALRSPSARAPRRAPDPRPSTGRLQTPSPAPAPGLNPGRLVLRLLTRANPLALPLPLTGDTPQPVISAALVPGTDDLLLIHRHDRQTDRHSGAFQRITRPARNVRLSVLGVDTGITVNEPAELETLDVAVTIDGDNALFDASALARAYGRDIPGVPSAGGDRPPSRPLVLVPVTQEERLLAFNLRASGANQNQINAEL